MKTATIDLLKKDLLIVELPRKSDVEIFPNSIEIYNQFTGQEETIKGSYTLLGSPDEIKESDARELVESWESVAKDGTRVYENYKNGIPKKRTAIESFNSALESDIFWDVNPIKIIPRGESSEHDRVKNQNEFNEAQEKTFDKNRSIILFKN